VIGMAVTRDGIPVRVWCWPGTAGSALIRQVKDDMRDWCLSKVTWVADRSFTSAENRRYLRKGGGSYIIGVLEVERGWRDMKQVIDLRLVYHRRYPTGGSRLRGR
jgi:transposase